MTRWLLVPRYPFTLNQYAWSQGTVEETLLAFTGFLCYAKCILAAGFHAIRCSSHGREDVVASLFGSTQRGRKHSGEICYRINDTIIQTTLRPPCGYAGGRIERGTEGRKTKNRTTARSEKRRLPGSIRFEKGERETRCSYRGAQALACSGYPLRICKREFVAFRVDVAIERIIERGKENASFARQGAVERAMRDIT